MKQYICKQCTKEFESARITRAPKFCSFECRDQSYTKIKSFKCEQCAIEVSANSRSIKNNRKFCSQNCANEWKKVAYCGKKIEYIKVNCKECNKELERQPSKIYTKNVFCDKSCACKFKHDKMSHSPRSQKYKLILNNGCEISVRSRWEILFIKDYLEKNNLKWQYEPRKFSLLNGKTYTPDFYIENFNQWIEVKGYEYTYQIENRNLFIKEYNYNLLIANKEVLEKDFNLNTKISYTKTLEAQQTRRVST